MSRSNLTLIALVVAAAEGCDVGAPGLGEVAVTAGQFTLSWNDNADSEDGFRLERRTGTTGTFALINTLPANTLSYTDAPLDPGQTYCYRVQAFNAAGASAFTNEACGTNLVAPPDAAPGGGEGDAGPGGGGDTTSPSIALTSPADGAIVSGGNKVVLAATASDDVGITIVDFFINGNLVCSDAVAPYACIWTVSRGKKPTSFTIEATASDAAGNQVSSAVTVRKGS